jgi:hypothetical protein
MENNKMDHKETGLEGMNRICLVQVRDQCRALMHTVLFPTSVKFLTN